MSADPIKFTVNGVEIEVPSVCMDYPLDRVNAENPYWTREALENVFKVFNINLPEVLGNVAEAVGDQIVNNVVAGAAGDKIWTDTGAALPAGAEGGQVGDTVVGRVNNYPGIGAQPPLIAPLGVAPAGANLVVVTDMRVDPVGNVVINPMGGMQQGYAAKPFTCVAPIVYDGANDEVEHGAVGATTARTGGTNTVLNTLRTANDGTGHVGDPVGPGDWTTIPATVGTTLVAKAIGNYDTAADPPHVHCDVIGGPANVPVKLRYRGTETKSIEYPNVRTNDYLAVSYDSVASEWVCTGPHDAPLEGPGNIRWSLIDASDSNNIPAGWELLDSVAPSGGGVAIDPRGKFPFISSAGALGENGGVAAGDHKHTLPGGVMVSTATADVNVVARTSDYTGTQGILPPYIGFALLKRIK